MNHNSTIALSGRRTFEISRGNAEPVERPAKVRLRDVLRHALPSTASREANAYRVRNWVNLLRGLKQVIAARLFKVPHFYGMVYATVIRASGEVLDLGLISMRVVTTAGVNKIVAGLNATDTSTFSVFKYHGFGTGGTAEAAADTALVTELTTQYATDNTRPTGSQTTGGSSNIYRTVGTLSPDATVAITEHGVFSQAAVAGGTLLDRSLFSTINLVSGDSLQITYDGTFAAGG